MKRHAPRLPEMLGVIEAKLRSPVVRVVILRASR